ncbi:MAG: hypothetical protein AYK23_03055 [Candidatus Proteinoplasmatales archaeon SG8-5]|nr:MAG: hypothetical protein AYK23_03055 [Candidatus Proteinoplasmatales archaeon SG8-5]
MNIIVYGAGAIGSLFGGFVAKNNDVTLIGRKEHMDAVRTKGLTITGKTELHTRPRTAITSRECGPADLLVLTVKSYDTEMAVRDVGPLIREDTVVMSLQNGLGNLEAILDTLKHANVIGGVTSHGAVIIEPGVIEHTGIGDTTVGDFAGSGNAEPIAQLLTESGIQTETSDNIIEDVWFKALVNAAINPLATLANSPNGVLLEDEGLRRMAREIVSEGVRVAKAHDIKLDEQTAYSRVMKVAEQTSQNRNSMLQDLARGKRTEIDRINGAIAKLGAEVGIDTPVNIGLVTQIKYIEEMA